GSGEHRFEVLKHVAGLSADVFGDLPIDVAADRAGRKEQIPEPDARGVGRDGPWTPWGKDRLTRHGAPPGEGCRDTGPRSPRESCRGVWCAGPGFLLDAGSSRAVPPPVWNTGACKGLRFDVKEQAFLSTQLRRRRGSSSTDHVVPGGSRADGCGYRRDIHRPGVGPSPARAGATAKA